MALRYSLQAWRAPCAICAKRPPVTAPRAQKRASPLPGRGPAPRDMPLPCHRLFARNTAPHPAALCPLHPAKRRVLGRQKRRPALLVRVRRGRLAGAASWPGRAARTPQGTAARHNPPLLQPALFFAIIRHRPVFCGRSSCATARPPGHSLLRAALPPRPVWLHGTPSSSLRTL